MSEDDQSQNSPLDDEGNPPPWWHSTPSQPPVDSMFVEGLKLAGALRNWAVDSGAVAAAAEVAQNAAASASALLAQATEQHPQTEEQPEEEPEPAQVVRCTDCPICQGLDALERTNPEWAHTARAALSQINDLVAGLLGPAGGQANP